MQHLGSYNLRPQILMEAIYFPTRIDCEQQQFTMGIQIPTMPAMLVESPPLVNYEAHDLASANVHGEISFANLM